MAVAWTGPPGKRLAAMAADDRGVEEPYAEWGYEDEDVVWRDETGRRPPRWPVTGPTDAFAQQQQSRG
eukprot:10356892-Alexandrium_andersonii.AAC.1